MKVSLSDNRLIKIGKDIPADRIDGESIGMILFRGDGPMIFRAGMEKALSDHNYVRRWYLSVIDAIAMEKTVLTCAIEDLRWCEVDYPSDLQKAEAVVSCFSSANVFDAVKRKYKGLETAVR